ncbi:MAG: glycoside hydrolase family 2 protein [Vibrionaceae bacterium]|nr:glycoside hydrolase family 2 protein [Vibrionaceae bacterium]
MRNLFTLSAVAVAIAMAGCNDSTTDVISDVVSPEFESTSRTAVSISESWKYQMDYDDNAAISPDFNDSEWEDVNLPHSVDAEHVVNVDLSTPHFKGINTYRKTLLVTKEEGKRQYLEFDGSAMITTVYVNGEKAGEHTGGFMRFRIDITEFVTDGENSIVIQVDNRPYDSAVHEKAFLPMETGQDYTYYGGIYRDVKLVQISEVGIDAEDYGSSGVYFMQTHTTDDTSDIYSNIRVRNKSQEKFNGHIRTIIQDAEGKIVYSHIASATVDADSVTEVENEFTLNDIHLWNGVNDPYLYQIFVQVFDGDKLLDQVEQPLGLRYFEFDKDKGFFLNGHEYRLNGVAMHQDRDVVGWSTTQEMREDDLDLIREMGARSIRFSHYPHALDTSEYSNELGFMNYLELPIVNKYLTEEANGEAGAQYLESAKEQMRALIRQNFNFPSMAVVGTANETGTAMGNSEANTEWLNELAAVVKEEFGARFGKTVPYRKSTLATITAEDIGDPDWDTVEMPCHNRYYGWYYGAIDDVGGFIDELKEVYPDLPFCMSEYGAGVSTLPEYAAENPVMQDHSSQWGNLFHEGNLKAFNERDWVWGTYVWNMFDFSVDGRNEGDTIGRNDKGLVKFDHTTKKDQFYFYKANWSDMPMLHLVDKNLAETTSRAVKVYSNLDEVTLSVNGEKVGSKKRSDNDPALAGVFEWTSEELESYFVAEQSNHIEVSGVKNGQNYGDTFDRYIKPYEGNLIHSDSIAVLTAENTRADIDNVVSHLPENTTFETLKGMVTLDLGAYWGVSSSDEALVDGDTFEVIADNGDIRTYTVKETSSLSTYRNVYTDLRFDRSDPDGSHLEMFDGDIETAPIAMAGFDAENVNQMLSIDLGAVYFVNTVQPIQEIDATDTYTLQVNGDILGMDKVSYTEPSEWTTGDIDLDGGAQAIRRVELKITSTSRIVTVPGYVVPQLSFSEINVYGGLIKGDLLGLNYQERTFTLAPSIETIDDLNSAITKVDSLGAVSDPVTVTFLDSNNQEVSELSAVSQIKVSQTRNGLLYSEVYNAL